MKELMVFREKVFKYIKQDWTDVIARASSIWRPRARYEEPSSNDAAAIKSHTSDHSLTENQDEVGNRSVSSEESLPPALRMIFPQSSDDESDPSVLVDEDELGTSFLLVNIVLR
jgi:hypothetical protein